MQNEKPKREKFTKNERLCGKKTIDALFEKGKSFLVFPYRVIYTIDSPAGKAPVQVAFGVSKKYSKRAVKRNLIRRRMREAFRKNKNVLYQNILSDDKRLHLFLSYVAKEEQEYLVLEAKMIKVFERLVKENQKSSS
jgi:ribonuclease P protein component